MASRVAALTVGEVMSTDVLALPPRATLRDAVEALASRHISGAPVVDGSTVVGTISAGDILRFEAVTPGVPMEREETDDLLEDFDPWEEDALPPAAYFTELWEDAGADVFERFASSEGPEWDVLSEHLVMEAMSTHVISLDPGASLQDAAEELQSAGIHRALVLEQGRLVGIVTTMDITRAVARYPLPPCGWPLR